MTKNVELRTPRLILRDIQEADRPELVEQINDIDVVRWLGLVPHPYTQKDADEYFKHLRKGYQKDPREDYPLALINRETGEFMGCVGIHKIDRLDMRCSMGYWLGKNHWRNGYMFEAVNEVIRYVFEDLGLRRIEIQAYDGNDASNALIKKVGFIYEGTRREGAVSKATGQIHDAHTYAMLRKDWEK